MNETRGATGRTGRLLTASVLAAGGVVAGAAEAAAEPDRRSAAAASAPCVWAGVPYPPGTVITAGGGGFTCGVERGEPYWYGGPVDDGRAVSNPGAAADPVGRFSPGARQPGTSYTDYCVGAQLIEGAEDVYQVVVTREGRHLWKAATPISDWAFTPEDPRPEPTWRTASLCVDGMLT